MESRPSILNLNLGHLNFVFVAVGFPKRETEKIIVDHYWDSEKIKVEHDRVGDVGRVQEGAEYIQVQMSNVLGKQSLSLEEQSICRQALSLDSKI